MNHDVEPTIVAEGETDLDERGVPMTLAAARSLSHGDLSALVRRVICDLEDIDDAEIDAFDLNPEDQSPLIESQLGVDVFNELTQHLSETTISVAGIEEWRWSSIDGLATAVEIALRKIKA